MNHKYGRSRTALKESRLTENTSFTDLSKIDAENKVVFGLSAQEKC